MTQPTQAQADAATKFAMEMLRQIPRGDKHALEAHLTGVLIVFWSALWGTFGTEFARGFIEAQLQGMEPDVPHEKFVEPQSH